MDSERIVRLIALVTLCALGFFVGLGLGIANAAEPDRCATIVVTDQGTPNVLFDRISVDDGLAIDRVGHFIWMQNTAEEPSSTEHLVSFDLNALPSGEVTLCTGDTTWYTEEQPAIVQVVDEPTVKEWVVPGPEPRALRVWLPL